RRVRLQHFHQRLFGRFRRIGSDIAAVDKRVEAIDQILVVALGLHLVLLERAQQAANAIEAFENEGDRYRSHLELAVAELAEDALAGMSNRLQPGQAEKSARPLDGMNQPENAGEQLGIVRALLELHQ